tara:strand:+ start:65 stop:553 length:489 start_codon:yes stop_codon:yes gene_type:complete
MSVKTIIGMVKIGGEWVWKTFGDDALALGKAWVKRGPKKHPPSPPKISVSQIKKEIVNAGKTRTRPPGTSAKPPTPTQTAVQKADVATRPTHRPKGTPGGSTTVRGKGKQEYLRDLSKRLSDAERVGQYTRQGDMNKGGKVKKRKPAAKKYKQGGRVAKYKG